MPSASTPKLGYVVAKDRKRKRGDTAKPAGMDNVMELIGADVLFKKAKGAFEAHIGADEVAAPVRGRKIGKSDVAHLLT